MNSPVNALLTDIPPPPNYSRVASDAVTARDSYGKAQGAVDVPGGSPSAAPQMPPQGPEAAAGAPGADG